MNTKRKHQLKAVLAYALVAPFMVVGGLAYVATVGWKAGWAWAEHLGEKYL